MHGSLAGNLPNHLFGPSSLDLFILLMSFIATFVFVRANTRVARARGRSRFRIGSVVTRGGLHVHHSVFGIVGMLVVGILEFALRPAGPWAEMLAFAFGCGAALTLDEFALILHLEDVYWTREGRKSIDAVILGLAFILLLLTGLLPRSVNELGDVVETSRWIGSGVILGGLAFVLACYLKGKLWTGTAGIFFPPLAVLGGVRLARPGSPWARRRYAGRPELLRRAEERERAFNTRWLRRKHLVWDAIGGAPHQHRASVRTSRRAGHPGSDPPDARVVTGPET